MPEHGLDLGAAQGDRDARRSLGADQFLGRAERPRQDLPVQKLERAQRLILRGGADALRPHA
jgi:hypothetical protein